jgi:hypothetical protein
MEKPFHEPGDLTPTIPTNDLTITLSRFREDDGTYVTSVKFSRTVRRYYAIGLVSDVLEMLVSNKCETIIIGEYDEQGNSRTD